MKEFKIEIDIDEDGNIIAETKGVNGPICVTELDAILAGLEGERSEKNKPEYFQGGSVVNKTKNKI